MLSYFSVEPRPVQVAVAQKVVAAMREGATCFTVNMPTGAGKSHVAMALARWAADNDLRTIIAPPNEQLQMQYQRDFPQLASLWGAYSYRCHAFKTKCGARTAAKHQPCIGCSHQMAVTRAAASPIALMNAYTLLAYRRKGLIKHPDVLIVDEAHKLIDFQLSQTQPVKIWYKQHQWPPLATVEDLVTWIDSKAPNPLLARAKALVLGNKGDVLINDDDQEWRGKPERCLEIRPLYAEHAMPTLWPPSKVKYVILLSATVGPTTAKDLGLERLHKGKTAYIECESPIHHACRPNIYWPTAHHSHANKDAALAEIAAKITQLLEFHKGSGIVHASYGDAEKLAALLTDPRLMWHNRENKSQVLQQFMSPAGRGRVLVASGMREGVDLKYDTANWQVLTKVPYPNLTDPWTAMKAEKDPTWYAREAVQEILQASGRVCRTPTDYGATYILDAHFGRLYENYEFLFPSWFKEALRWPSSPTS